MNTEDMRPSFDKFNIYLAGTKTEVEYRNTFLSTYKNSKKINIIDPFTLVDQNLPPEDLVYFDKLYIVDSDLLIAKVSDYTAGTIMEICFAYENDIFVWLISDKENIINDPWIVTHTSRIFDSVESAIANINSR